MTIKNEPEVLVSQRKIEGEFSKEQLLASKRFEDRKDIVNTLLNPDKLYTVEAVEQEICKFMKGKVK